MSETKESDLVTAVLLYAMRCLAEGDQPALRGMNFGPEEVSALRELGLEDLYHVAALQAHCLTIRLNRSIYWAMVTHLRRERRSESLQRDLIESDAPLEMMQRLFGVGAREYTRLRRLLTIGPSAGRPSEPDEAVSKRLWPAWRKLISDYESEELPPPDVYLALRDETGASLRTIWTLTSRWLEDGGQEEARESPTKRVESAEEESSAKDG